MLRRWRPGSRVERLRGNHTYGFVLLLLAVTYVFIVAAPNEGWARAVLIIIEGGTLALALWTSGFAYVRPAVLLGVLTGSIAVLDLLVGGSTMKALDFLVALLLVSGTMLVIGLGVFDQREINRQAVTGAVGVYLFIGILFTYLYGAEAALGTGAFFAQGTDGSPAVWIYFSYVTLATLGYGDYTAAAQPGRTFAIAEALLGQLYLVTVVALLVSRFGRPARNSTA